MQLTLFIAALASVASALPLADPETKVLEARRLRYNRYDPYNEDQYKHLQNYRPFGRQRGPIYRQPDQYDQYGNRIKEFYDPYSTQGGGVQRGVDRFGNPAILNGGATCKQFDEYGNCVASIAK